MNKFAKAIMQIKYFQQRQKRLGESIDRLSFDYPDVYATLFREIKKRELEANDPNKINNWLDTSNSYEKLHEALMLVKNNNMIAKEAYTVNLKRMLTHTITNGTYINEAMKVCYLIEKSPSLSSIYE